MHEQQLTSHRSSGGIFGPSHELQAESCTPPTGSPVHRAGPPARRLRCSLVAPSAPDSPPTARLCHTFPSTLSTGRFIIGQMGLGC